MSGTPNRRQHRYRFRTDADAVNSAATWGAAESTAFSLAPGVNFRLRFLIWNDGTATTGNQSWSIYWRKNATGSYAAVTTSSSNVRAVDAGSSADNDSLSTQRLTSPASGTFVNGQYDETGATGNVAITTGNFSEFEFGLQLQTADLAVNDYIDFQVYAGGVALQAYDVTPRITALVATSVVSPAANITIAAVAPSISAGKSVAVPAATITLTALAPIVSTGVAVAAPTATITIAATAPTAVGPPIPGIFDSGIFDTGIFDHRAAGGAATITVPAAVDITLAALAPSVASGASVTIPAANVAVAALAPSVASGVAVAVASADLVIFARAPNVITGLALVVPPAAIEVAALAPSVVSGASIAAPVANIVIAANAPTISRGVGVSVPAANITISGFACAVFASGGETVQGRDGGTNSEADSRARFNRLQIRAALVAKQAAEIAEREKPKVRSIRAAARKAVETLEDARELGGALLSDDYINMLDRLIAGMRIDFLGPTIDPAKAALLAMQAQAVVAVANELRALQQDEEDAIVALLMAA